MLRMMLSYEADVAVVGEAKEASEVLQLVGEEEPDVLLLDLSMPELDELDVVRLVRECSPRTRVIVFSGYDADLLNHRQLTRGTTALSVKGAGRAELVAAIRGVVRVSI